MGVIKMPGPVNAKVKMPTTRRTFRFMLPPRSSVLSTDDKIVWGSVGAVKRAIGRTNKSGRSHRLFELAALVRTQQPTSGDAYLRVRHPKHAAIEQVVDESAGKADSDERRYPRGG